MDVPDFLDAKSQLTAVSGLNRCDCELELEGATSSLMVVALASGFDFFGAFALELAA
jgi:hypothetical protein